MKIRFSVKDNRAFASKGQPYMGIDTSEIVSFDLDVRGELELWLKGGTDSVLLTEQKLGSDNFNALLTLLCSEFPDINDLKLRTISKTDR